MQETPVQKPDSAMQPDEQQPKILPPLSEVIPFTA